MEKELEKRLDQAVLEAKKEIEARIDASVQEAVSKAHMSEKEFADRVDARVYAILTAEELRRFKNAAGGRISKGVSPTHQSRLYWNQGVEYYRVGQRKVGIFCLALKYPISNP